jgi:hypothetical protein
MEHAGPAGQVDLPTKNASNVTWMNIKSLHLAIRDTALICKSVNGSAHQNIVLTSSLGS